MRYQNLGPVAVVGAAFLWSLDGFLRRQLFSLPPSVVVFWEHLLGLVVLAPLVIWLWQGFGKLNRNQWFTIILVSLLSGALGTIFYTAALGKIQFIPFSVVVLLQQTQPLFAILAAALLLKEPFGKRFWALAGVAIVATYFVSFPELRVNTATGAGTLVAALLALGAAASWGSSTAFSKYTLRGTPFLHVTAARFAFAPIFALLLTGLLGKTSQLTQITGTQWLYLLAITFSTGLVALAIYYFGLQRVPASRSTLLELTWPVSAMLIGYVFLGERLTPTQILGSIVLITTMYLIAHDAKKVQATPSLEAVVPGNRRARQTGRA